MRSDGVGGREGAGERDGRGEEVWEAAGMEWREKQAEEVRNVQQKLYKSDREHHDSATNQKHIQVNINAFFPSSAFLLKP